MQWSDRVVVSPAVQRGDGQVGPCTALTSQCATHRRHRRHEASALSRRTPRGAGTTRSTSPPQCCTSPWRLCTPQAPGYRSHRPTGPRSLNRVEVCADTVGEVTKGLDVLGAEVVLRNVGGRVASMPTRLVPGVLCTLITTLEYFWKLNCAVARRPAAEVSADVVPPRTSRARYLTSTTEGLREEFSRRHRGPGGAHGPRRHGAERLIVANLSLVELHQVVHLVGRLGERNPCAATRHAVRALIQATLHHRLVAEPCTFNTPK